MKKYTFYYKHGDVYQFGGNFEFPETLVSGDSFLFNEKTYEIKRREFNIKQPEQNIQLYVKKLF